MTNLKYWSVFAVLLFIGCTPEGAVEPVKSPRKPERPQQIEALGRLEPEVGVLNLGAMAGTRIESLEVSVGDQVEAGTILAHVDTYPLRVAQHESAEAQLAEAEAKLAAEVVYAEMMIREAELSIEQAEFAKMDIAAQEAQIELHEANLELAQRDLERMEGLDTSLVPEQQLEHQQLLVRSAKAELKASQQALEKLKAADALNVELAQAKLATAQSSLPRLKAGIPVGSLRTAVEMAKQQIEMSIIRAPIAGRIIKIFVHKGETIGQQPVLQMTDTSEIMAVAEVYETDIRWVEVGQKAEIYSDALPTSVEVLNGTVESIGSTVAQNSLMNLDPTRARTDARVVEVLIRIDDGSSVEHLLNLQVSVSIDTSNGTEPTTEPTESSAPEEPLPSETAEAPSGESS